jgi:hypothetical protein
MIQKATYVENVSRQHILQLEDSLAQHLHAAIELSQTPKNKPDKAPGSAVFIVAAVSPPPINRTSLKYLSEVDEL